MAQNFTPRQLESREDPKTVRLKKKRKEKPPLKCPRMPLAELNGLLQPFTKNGTSLSSPLSAMDLLASFVLSADNWPTLIATAYSVSST